MPSAPLQQAAREQQAEGHVLQVQMGAGSVRDRVPLNRETTLRDLTVLSEKVSSHSPSNEPEWKGLCGSNSGFSMAGSETCSTSACVSLTSLTIREWVSAPASAEQSESIDSRSALLATPMPCDDAAGGSCFIRQSSEGVPASATSAWLAPKMLSNGTTRWPSAFVVAPRAQSQAERAAEMA
eukprot:CAMPEP_0176011974 /NCGR_PEP_ID=MMETSP0120_2-20121206/5555_1 /TAXON_ID=160619 /ORGANISM="Kryptoperidinium foliaceum, Strain CCMP 1326" /LENGTH=181 /DNA_ID=CAMNT_0017344843 /DNA_START=282 /DNA_END=828 /DNA_ORIENTATION=-